MTAADLAERIARGLRDPRTPKWVAVCVAPSLRMVLHIIERPTPRILPAVIATDDDLQLQERYVDPEETVTRIARHLLKHKILKKE